MVRHCSVSYQLHNKKYDRCFCSAVCAKGDCVDIWMLTSFVAIAMLTAGSAFFSGSETVFFSLDALQVRRIKSSHGRRGNLVERLLQDPPSLLATLLIGNVIINVTLASLSYHVFQQFLTAYAEEVSIAATTLLILICGEIGPKRLSLAHAEKLAVIVAPAINLCKIASAPLRFLLEKMTTSLRNLMSGRFRHLTNEEYETALDIGGEEGLLADEEWVMVKAITRLQDLSGADVMTPRVDLQGIDLEDVSEPDEVAEIARRATRKTLVLYRGQIDNIVGFLDVRKLLLDPQHVLANAIFKAFFVPEIAPLDKVWTQLQQHRYRNAVAVDEYGGIAGLITRGDILEEITGEIYSDLNKEEPMLEEAGRNRWIVDPHLSLEDLNRKLDIHLEASDSERLSGWITEQLGHVPEMNDIIESQGCRVTVLQTSKRRMTSAMIERVRRG